ncbi:hypothetical protein GCM10027280_45310 [Micromonospora polyrhachis]|uniref:Uncharacterized protein n=1 Tax=Micromonospora polyrhachis TaxID=1282883 RepID=A0A7W7WPI1_9ACTN|nr:hypothetical protein [Micromonospora polyrhachis]MBB4958955.1 hypothetical protein [Micromonospora polyrhachis]
MTCREPEWSDDDRAWMLALAYYRDTRCPLCGGDIRDCTAPEDDVVVTVPPPRRCLATDELRLATDQHKDKPGAGALLWRTEVRRR